MAFFDETIIISENLPMIIHNEINSNYINEGWINPSSLSLDF